jgi:hypothetical protein
MCERAPSGQNAAAKRTRPDHPGSLCSKRLSNASQGRIRMRTRQFAAQAVRFVRCRPVRSKGDDSSSMVRKAAEAAAPRNSGAPVAGARDTRLGSAALDGLGRLSAIVLEQPRPGLIGCRMQVSRARTRTQRRAATGVPARANRHLGPVSTTALAQTDQRRRHGLVIGRSPGACVLSWAVNFGVGKTPVRTNHPRVNLRASALVPSRSPEETLQIAYVLREQCEGFLRRNFLRPRGLLVIDICKSRASAARCVTKSVSLGEGQETAPVPRASPGGHGPSRDDLDGGRCRQPALRAATFRCGALGGDPFLRPTGL